MESESPLPHSQEPHTYPAVQPLECTLQLPNVTLISDIEFQDSVTEKGS
jgi:hypothetical protein